MMFRDFLRMFLVFFMVMMWWFIVDNGVWYARFSGMMLYSYLCTFAPPLLGVKP